MRTATFLISIFICMNLFSQQNQLIIQANKFISTLTENQRSIALYDFGNEERYNWHFFPKTDRKGISLKTLNTAQKGELIKFLQQCLSAKGLEQSLSIMQLEGILKQLEKRPESDDYRDPDKYHFIFFGTPVKDDPWGWRLEGHHLSLNFSAIKDRIIAGTPSFMGTNPGIVPSGPNKGMQVLKKEADKGYQLVQSLSKEQQVKAIISKEAPNEILTFVSRKAIIPEQSGILYNELDKNQQQFLIELLQIYIARYTKLFAVQMFNEMKQAGLDQLRFSWAGSLESGKGHYYRITGPTILIEYDNTQNNANHVHSVIRDLKNDFGGDELIKHYRKEH